jgi:hypothetical protein
MQAASAYSSKAVRRAGLVAVFAALLGVVADLALQYTPNAAHLLSDQSLYFLDVSPSRLFFGHYLGIVAILAEIAGFWQVYCALGPGRSRLALLFFLISSFGAMRGASFHGTAIFVGLTLQAQNAAGAASHQAFSGLLASFDLARVGLAIPALLGIVLSSLLYMFVVGFRSSDYPRWMAICNPLTFILLIVVLALSIRPLALVLAPTALNLGHLMFFILSTGTLWNIGSEARPAQS